MKIAVCAALAILSYPPYHRGLVEWQASKNLRHKAIQLQQQLDTLENQVQNLRQRAGVNKTTPAKPLALGQTLFSPVDALMTQIQIQLVSLSGEFSQAVRPRMEAVLTQEAARPFGVPICEITRISSYFWFPQRHPR